MQACQEVSSDVRLGGGIICISNNSNEISDRLKCACLVKNYQLNNALGF